MDQSVFLLIGGILAVAVAILVLLFALYGFQQSLKETNRRRRDGPATDYQRIELPEIATRSNNSGLIEFGEIIDFDSTPEHNFTTPPDPDLGKCTLCRKNFSDNRHVLCPNCQAKYHEHCFAEYDMVCTNCGWRQYEY